jgi:hypothetical protein
LYITKKNIYDENGTLRITKNQTDKNENNWKLQLSVHNTSTTRTKNENIINMFLPNIPIKSVEQLENIYKHYWLNHNAVKHIISYFLDPRGLSLLNDECKNQKNISYLDSKKIKVKYINFYKYGHDHNDENILFRYKYFLKMDDDIKQIIDDEEINNYRIRFIPVVSDTNKSLSLGSMDNNTSITEENHFGTTTSRSFTKNKEKRKTRSLRSIRS